MDTVAGKDTGRQRSRQHNHMAMETNRAAAARTTRDMDIERAGGHWEDEAREEGVGVAGGGLAGEERGADVGESGARRRRP